MSKAIAKSKLTTYGKSETASDVDNAVQFSMIFQSPSLEPGQYRGMLPAQYGSKLFFNRLKSEAPKLLEPATLSALPLFHQDMAREAGFLKGHKPKGTPIPKDQARLIYSFFFHVMNPESSGTEKFRDGMHQMFKMLELGQPLAMDEVLAQSGTLAAIASRIGQAHAQTH
jgi:hypothetical protein